MKKGIFSLIAVMILAAIPAHAFDIKDALKKIGSKDSTSTSGGLGSILGNLLSTDKIELKSMVGNWSYSAPAVSFKSDNLLKKAGGAAASATITGKLAPIYKTAGFDKMTLTIAEDSTFSMKVRGITLKGTIENVSDNSSDANFIFNFKVAGKINVGKMNTYVTKNAAGNMSITFDVSKLITLVEKVSIFTNNSTLKSASALLNSYDGLCAGFELKKQ